MTIKIKSLKIDAYYSAQNNISIKDKDVLKEDLEV